MRAPDSRISPNVIFCSWVVMAGLYQRTLCHGQLALTGFLGLDRWVSGTLRVSRPQFLSPQTGAAFLTTVLAALP